VLTSGNIPSGIFVFSIVMKRRTKKFISALLAETLSAFYQLTGSGCFRLAE
jgi:zinc transporter ZupT